MKGGGHVTADECLRRHPPWAKLRRNAPPFRAIAMTPDNRFNRPAQIILRHSFASIANDLGFAGVTIAALVPAAQREQNWTPIRDQICKPIDRERRAGKLLRRLMAGTTPQIWLIFIGYSKRIEPVGDVRICRKKQRSGFGTLGPSDDLPG